jgi:hypothetical protein
MTDEKARIAALEKSLAQAHRQLQDARKAKLVIPAGGRKMRGGKGYCRVVVPDSHGSSIDKGAAKAFLDDLDRLKPREGVLIGDHIDCGGFLAQHLGASYLAETAYSFEEDAQVANTFLDEIQSRTPGCTWHYLSGNHEHRVEKWVVQQTERHPKDADYLGRMFSIPKVLHLEKRGINWYPQGGQYGSVIRGFLRLGKCWFTHGQFTTKNAAKSHVDEYGCNIVFGHTHRADSYTRRTINSTHTAWNPGCLCLQQPYFMHTKNTHHTHGYGIQAVQEDDAFLHLNVPIIDGRSYLSPLATQLGAAA